MAPIDPDALKKLAKQVQLRLKELGLDDHKFMPIVRQQLIYEGKIIVLNRSHAQPFLFFLDPLKHPDAFKI